MPSGDTMGPWDMFLQLANSKWNMMQHLAASLWSLSFMSCQVGEIRFTSKKCSTYVENFDGKVGNQKRSTCTWYCACTWYVTNHGTVHTHVHIIVKQLNIRTHTHTHTHAHIGGAFVVHKHNHLLPTHHLVGEKPRIHGDRDRDFHTV